MVTLASALVLIACASAAVTEKEPLLGAGDVCTVKKTGQPGRCTPISECAVVLEAAYQGVVPQVCSLVGTVTTVCCPQGSAHSTKPVEIANRTACTVSTTGNEGVCRPFADCPAAIQAASLTILPQRCEHHGSGQELVCCEDLGPALTDTTTQHNKTNTQQKTGSKAADYCLGLAEKVYPSHIRKMGWYKRHQCPPKPDPTTVFNNTRLNVATELPHWVTLGSGELFDIQWRCPGNLISEQWVLSSSRCLDEDSELRYVGLGGSFNPYNCYLLRNIKRIIRHPDYNKTTWAYDNIALLELDRPVTFSWKILPACLHTGGPVPAEGLLMVGWTMYPMRFVKVTVAQVSDADCTKSIIQDTTNFPEVPENSSLMCTSPKIPKDSCGLVGSGTPLQVHNGDQVECTYLLLGISSAYIREHCIDVYTRVDAFLPWIEGYVWP